MLTELEQDAIAGRVVVPPGGPPRSVVTTSATNIGTASDTRLFIDDIRYLAKTGIAWADLPTCFGKPNSLWQRYNRWCRNGVWAAIAAELRDDDTEWLSVDSTCVRANVAAVGAKNKPTAPAASWPRRWAAAAAGSAPRSTPR